MNVLALHFTHPEGYPPALNAINCIAKKATKLTILTTDTLPTKWKYAKNIDLKLIDGEHDRFKFVNRSKFEKFKTYFLYIKKVRSFVKKENIDLVIIYDDVPFFLYLLATILLKKNYKLWYHNHDVYPLSSFKKYGINWWGAYTRDNYFNKIDYFSLPAIERKKMFPLSTFRGKFFFIPNYPSKNFIDLNEPLTINEKELRIVYPGSPSNKNGFKELIDVMETKINTKTITLTIIGEVNPNYKTELFEYAKSKNIANQLRFVDRIPYTEMTHELKKYHIGWAVYKPVDLSVATAGSSSNKIYEFLANGLPIVVFDNEHHREYLEQCKAAFFCNLSSENILNVLTAIDSNLLMLSTDAKKEFEQKYQFEFKFEEALNEVVQSINK